MDLELCSVTPALPLSLGSLVCALAPQIRALLPDLALSTSQWPERRPQQSLSPPRLLTGPRHRVVTLPDGEGPAGLTSLK